MQKTGKTATPLATWGLWWGNDLKDLKGKQANEVAKAIEAALKAADSDLKALKGQDKTADEVAKAIQAVLEKAPNPNLQICRCRRRGRRIRNWLLLLWLQGSFRL